MTATGTAIAPRDALKRELDRLAPSYEKMLPKGYRPDRLIAGAMLAVTKNPDLLRCTPVSVAVALGQVAQLGLDVGITAHLVPYGNACTFVADYKGYIELMVKAGARKVEAQVVREGDHFEFAYGTEPYLRHRPAGGKGRITHAYAIVWHRRGDTQFEVMAVEDVEAIRAKSKSWAKGDLLDWYARKTVVRRIAKYVPKNPALDLLFETEGAESPAEVVDPETGEVLSATVEGAPDADA